MKLDNKKNCIFILGILGYVDEKHLRKFNIGRKTLNFLLQEKVIQKEKIGFNNNFNDVYFLTNTGIKKFKKYHNKYNIGRSRSKFHDYIHSKNVLTLINNIEDLYSYTNERSIRYNLDDEIKKYEIKFKIEISCPDCSIMINNKKVYIETIVTRGRDREQRKVNFKYILKDNEELIIYKIGVKGGEYYEK